MERSLAVFSAWILSESKSSLYGQKKSRWSTEVMSKTIGTVFVMLERETYFASCKVLNNCKYDTWLKDYLKMV